MATKKCKITLLFFVGLLMVFVLYAVHKYRVNAENTVQVLARDRCQNTYTSPNINLAPLAIVSPQGTEVTGLSISPGTKSFQNIEAVSPQAEEYIPQRQAEAVSPQAEAINPQETKATTLISVVNKTSVNKIQTFLLTLVLSAPKNVEQRDVIRRTWKNSYVTQGKEFLVKFMIGTQGLNDEDRKSLVAESELHNNDLVFLTDLVDSYDNLTRKVLYMFMWADQNVEYSYMLKADDDAFARLDTMESVLKARTTNTPLYWGLILKGGKPLKGGRWKEDKWDLCDTYLPYAQGGGYVLSADLVHRIAINADGLILYHNEDTSVGAWVSPFKLERKHDAQFVITNLAVLNKVDQKCDTYLLLSSQSVDLMDERYNFVKSTCKS